MPAKIYKILNSCKQNSQFVDTKFSICHYKILKTSLFVVTLTVCTEIKQSSIGCHRNTCYQSRYGAQYSEGYQS